MLKRANARKLAVLVAVLASLYVAGREAFEGGPFTGRREVGRTAAGGEADILRAFDERRSSEWVVADGTVARVLSDDTRGARHQRFILRLPSGHTVLVSHNIDLAPRVEGLEAGDAVAFRGEYEWNPQGGVVHWTHHDPDGRREGGWLEHDGRRYR